MADLARITGVEFTLSNIQNVLRLNYNGGGEGFFVLYIDALYVFYKH